MYRIIIADLEVLYGLEGFFDCSDIEFLDGTFYAICSTLDKEQQEKANELERLGALSFAELPKDEEVTSWLYEHYTPEVGVNDLCVIKYALLNDFTILTNDEVMLRVAKSLGAKAMNTATLMEQADDYIVLGENMEFSFILRCLTEHPKHGKLDDIDFAAYEEKDDHDYERDFSNRIIL